jgi:MFS family permease
MSIGFEYEHSGAAQMVGARHPGRVAFLSMVDMDVEHSGTLTARVAAPCIGVPCVDVAPWGDAKAAGRVSLLLGTLFGLATTGSSAVAVVLPAIGADLGLAPSGTPWVISAYALSLAVCTAVYGRVADLMGIRRPLVVGVILMSVGALAAAFATSLPLLIAARLVQGAGAAAPPVLATALLSERYEGSTRAAALGRVAGIAAAMSALGPLIGGAVESWLGWRPVLALPAVGLLLLPLVVRVAPTAGRGRGLDLTGAVLVAGTATGVVLLAQSPAGGPAIALVGGVLLLVGAPLLARHVLSRRPDGFLPRDVVRNRVVVWSAVAGASLPGAWFALLVAVPAWLAGRGWQPLAIGAALIPSAAVALLSSRLSRPLIARLGARVALFVAVLVAGAALLLATAGAAAGWPALLVTAVAVVTAAFGLGQPAMVTRVSDGTSVDVRGIALGVATLIFLVGGGVGAALVGGLEGVLNTWAALAVAVALPVVGAVAALASPRSAPFS